MQENAYLVFGCYGRVDDNLVLCSTTENRILKLDDTLDNFDKIIEYFENLRLFDRPIMDQNAIRHLLFNLQNKFYQKMRPMWTETKFRTLEKYLQMHKMCGVYARLILVQEEQESQIIKEKEEPSIYIKAERPKLKLV